MQMITATELRTKSKDFFETLMSGESVDLIKGSRVIATAIPKKNKVRTFNAKRFLKIVEEMNLPKLSYKEREKKDIEKR